jgi:dolichol kinase
MKIQKEEIYRKAIHMSSLVYPIFYYFNDSKQCIVTISSFIFVLLMGVDYIRGRSKKLNGFFIRYLGFALRERESSKFTGATYFMLGALCAFLFFQKQIAIISVFILVIADTAASIVGIIYGRHKLVGNKSLEGASAFFISSVIISCIGSFVCGIHVFPLLIASLVVTIFELLSVDIGIDDNILIPLGYGICSTILIF